MPAERQREKDIKAIKTAVRERDGYRCTRCGMTNAESRERYGRSLDVHRVVRGSGYSTAPGICVTLCIGCHSQEPREFRCREDGEYRGAIAKAIKDARVLAGISLAELAPSVGLTAPSLCRVESGRHWPSLLTVLRIEEALHLPVGSLLDPK